MNRCAECNLIGGCWCDAPSPVAVVERPAVTGDWSTLAELREFVRSHGLNIYVEWGDSGRNLGWTQFRGETAVGVVFSRTLWPLLTPEERFDTLAHETAHALLPREAGHGVVWRIKCRKLGGNAERQTALPEHVERAISKWEGVCPNGHLSFRLALTKKARTVSCGKCSSHWNPEFKFTWKELR